MDAKHTARETLERYCAYVNVDVLSGWEKGIGPKRKVCGRLYDHWPPEHLTGQRYADWMIGYKAVQRYRKTDMSKSVHFVAYNKQDEQVVVRLKGWSAKRGQVLSRLEKQGCAGDVMVYYFDGSDIKRTVKCGI